MDQQPNKTPAKLPIFNTGITKKLPPHVRVLEMANGFYLTQMLYAAADLRIAEYLKDGPKSSRDLAGLTASHPESLFRLLRALASTGVLDQEEDGCFKSNALTDTLREDHPNSMRDVVLYLGSSFHWSCIDKLSHCVKTGRSGSSEALGSDFFEYLKRHPVDAEIFHGSMVNVTKNSAPFITTFYKFSGINVICDVGGGSGTLLAAILLANPSMRGILFDEESAVASAKAYLASQGVADRCETTSGDFFHSVPQGCDAYMLKYILHDWDDEQSIKILRACRRSMNLSSRLLVVEHIIPEDSGPHFGKLLDLEMMAVTGGVERTETQFKYLFEKSGLKLNAVVPLLSMDSIMELVPVP
jgi:hypothetical protein